MDIMESLVKNIINSEFEDIPPEAITAAKKAIIDTVGVMIAGSSVKGCQILVDYLRRWGGRKESTIAVFGEKLPCNHAAQANGAMARAWEIDDITDRFPLHPSASIVPTCLAVAEYVGEKSGKEFITAVALGQDLVIRMAFANKVSPVTSGRYNLFRVFSSTGSAGKLLGLSEEELLNAMGIVYSQMVGDGQAAREGVMTSYIQQGTISKSAIESTFMAQAGITGSKDVLQGPFGFYNAFEPDPDLEILTSDLGVRFLGTELSTKLYTACRFNHEAIDLALDMVREEALNQDSIDKITVRVPEQMYTMCCHPLDKKRHPKTLVEAQFSTPYTVAAAIVRGDVFIDELSDQAINDPEILELAQRITPIIDSECQTDLVIGSTVMEIKTHGGQEFSKKIEFPRGNPKNPVDMDGVIEKLRKCVKYSIHPFSTDQIDKMVDILCNIEQVDNVTKLPQLFVSNP